MSENASTIPAKPQGRMARLRASVGAADSAMRARTERSQRMTPPPPPMTTLLEQAMAIGGLPLLAIRLFWYNLREVRFWWPLVLPLLVWTAWRSYRDERARQAASDSSAQSRS